MRRVRYEVAMSLDGYIAGPNGEYDWIIMDPEIDFTALFNEFDTFLMGRKTFEAMAAMGGGMAKGKETFVFSRTLKQKDHKKVKVVAEKPEETIAMLKAKPGKDIWLFGGGDLFRSLAEAKLVDTVEVAIIPVLLGGGIPLFPSPSKQITLKLEDQKIYKTGIVRLKYSIA